jgi:hypothetical protein
LLWFEDNSSSGALRGDLWSFCAGSPQQWTVLSRGVANRTAQQQPSLAVIGVSASNILQVLTAMDSSNVRKWLAYLGNWVYP